MKTKRPSISQLLRKVHSLERDLAACHRERRQLLLRNLKLDREIQHRTGRQPEQFICECVNGTRMHRQAPYDVRAADGSRLEVKYSNLRTAGPVTYRWTWAHPLGNQGENEYDRLILLGKEDWRYRRSYKWSDDQPYVIFDVPHADVQRLITASFNITATTNPLSSQTQGVTRRLFRDYQITADELRNRYGRPSRK